MTISDAGLILGIIVIVALLWHQSRFRVIALAQARRYTQQHQMQLLDQTVALSKVSITKDQQNLPAIKREYRFEFTIRGDKRYKGLVVLIGHRLKNIESEPVSEMDFM